MVHEAVDVAIKQLHQQRTPVATFACCDLNAPFQWATITRRVSEYRVACTGGVAMEHERDGRHASVDVTALHERDREIARLSRLCAALSQINRAILSATTRDALLATICRALVEQGGFQMAWIGWADPAANVLRPVATHGDKQSYLDGIAIRTDATPEALGPTGTAFREERPYICNALFEDPSTLPWRLKLKQHGFRASAAFPIREGGKVQGALSLYADEAEFFRDKEVALLVEAAEDIAFGLDNVAREDARRHVEQTLRQERDFSDAVLSSLPGVLYLYDASGKFLRWNKNFETRTGYAADEIAKMHPLDFFSGADRDIVATRIQQTFEHGEASVDAEFLSKDGRLTPYHFTGVLTQLGGRACLVGVGIDIAKRKHAEEAQRASEERYRTLFQQAPDGIVIADANSYCLDANDSLCHMLGYNRDELIGMHATDIVLPSEIPQIDVALDAITSRSDYQREWKFRRKDGSTFAADVMATMMPDGNVLAMIRDVTERKKAEIALRELNETLEQKVAARTEELRAALVRAEAADRIKSAFLATMSHELRTPLNSIIGFTGVVLQGLAGPLTTEQSKQLGMVRGSARHLLDLINDVLDLSKIEAEQLDVHCEAFDLPTSIERVVGTVKPFADKKNLTLNVAIAPSLRQVVSDRRRVEQILMNLLTNAAKFTEHGGITLSIERVDEFRAEASATSATDCTARPAMRFRVRDTGIGIQPHELANLFQPFRQIDSGLTRQHEGTGLGLAICRRLAGLLGGEIHATSEWCQGSEFAVTLPIDGTSNARATPC